jgi:hypothetical protein
MLLAAFFTACDKEMPIAVDEQHNTEEQYVRVKLIDWEKVRFWYQGKLHQENEFRDLHKKSAELIMVAGSGLPEANVIYTFDSEADMNIWAKNVGLADKFAQINAPYSGSKVAKVTGTNGWIRLWEGNFRGDSRRINWVSPYGKKAFTGSFNNEASSLEIFPGNNWTGCELYDNDNYTGLMKRFYWDVPGTIGYLEKSDFIRFGIDEKIGSVRVY